MNMRWLCIASGVLLLLAIPSGWPYDFYILLRWVICISSIIVAQGFYKSKLTAWTFIFGAIAFLFNPIAPIYLSKANWIPIDFISAILFFVAAYSTKPRDVFKIILLFSLALPLLTIPTSVFAHPGNTDSLGCHTCWTNCPSWGLSYGEYHCHTPKIYSPPVIPSCPLNSYYDSLTESCKCYSGYVASGSRCISQDEYCQNLYGFNSRYNILNDTCECSYGYVFDGGRCISGNQNCWNKYGYNSSYNSLSRTCECSYGYVFDKAGTQCISRDRRCRELFGFGSKYDTLEGNCICSYGYKFEGNECVIDTSSYKSAPLQIPSLPTVTPTPTPTPKQPTPTTNIRSTQSQRNNQTPTPETANQYRPPYNLQSELKLNSRGEEVKILQSALATDKELYPEGIVSGFFGDATERAVKRFQGKYGLPETGTVNSATISKFNEVFGNQTASVTPIPEKSKTEKRSLLQIIWQYIGRLLKR